MDEGAAASGRRRTSPACRATPTSGARRRRSSAPPRRRTPRSRGAALAFFALKHQPPKQQPFLVALDDIEDASSERVVVDPNEIDSSGATTIDWYVPSPDGRLVAVSLSSHGTEDGTLHVFEVASGALVDVRIPRITMMGGSLAWRGDSGAFWYTRYPSPDERPQEDLRVLPGGVVPRARDDRGSPRPRRRVRRRTDRGERSCRPRPTAAGSWTGSSEATAANGRSSSARRMTGRGGRSRRSRTARWTSCSAATNCSSSRAMTRRTAGSSASRSGRDATVGRRASRSSPSRLARDRGPRRDRRTGSGSSRWTAGSRACAPSASTGAPLPPVELPPVCAIDEIVRAGADRVAYPVESFVEPRAWWVAADEDAVAAAHGAHHLDAARSVGAGGSAHVRDLRGTGRGSR